MFPINSRYHETQRAEFVTKDGTKIPFLRRRFVPPAGRFELVEEHTVTGGDRLDNIAAQFLGDPEQFWRIADANNAMRPEDLIVIGQKLKITLPEGLSGSA